MTMHGYEPCLLKNASYRIHSAENRDQWRFWLKTGTSEGFGWKQGPLEGFGWKQEPVKCLAENRDQWRVWLKTGTSEGFGWKQRPVKGLAENRGQWPVWEHSIETLWSFLGSLYHVVVECLRLFGRKVVTPSTGWLNVVYVSAVVVGRKSVLLWEKIVGYLANRRTGRTRRIRPVTGR